jgi:site-specific DNA-cytosine methylase
MKKIVLSLFDGISCGQVALSNFLNPDQYSYYTSEIDKRAMSITSANFPRTTHLGNLLDLDDDQLGVLFPNGVFLLSAGSPCTDLSIQGNLNGMSTTDGIHIHSYEEYRSLKDQGKQFSGQSYLFYEFIRVLKKLKPQYFLLENVKNKYWTKVMEEELGYPAVLINSSHFVPQNRERVYITNIPNVSDGIPEETKHLSGLIPGSIGGTGKRGVPDGNGGWVKKRTTRKDGLANCVTTGTYLQEIELEDGSIRKLTLNELESLQGLPKDYVRPHVKALSTGCKPIGNGWTVDVIKHIYSNIPEFNV